MFRGSDPGETRLHSSFIAPAGCVADARGSFVCAIPSRHAVRLHPPEPGSG